MIGWRGAAYGCVLAGCVLAAASCASDELSSKRAGNVCTRSSQCATGLTCRDGVCRGPASDGGIANEDDGGN